MTTPYQLIYSRFANKVQDYKLDQLFQTSIPAYESFLKGLLINAIDHFTECVVDLDDRDDGAQIFNQALSNKEQSILSLFLEYEWIDRQVNNIQDMELALSSSDFHRYAESNNLKVKSDLSLSIFERANSMMVAYSYKKYDFNKSQ
jgi:hypothetical protein